MAMFIHGFWFGASLVRKGTISAGDIMFVFWACSIATSNLQLCTSQLIILAKGKFAMAALMIEPPPTASFTSTLGPKAAHGNFN